MVALVCASIAFARSGDASPRLDHVGRVTRGVAASGWVPAHAEVVPSVIPLAESEEGAREFGPPYAWPPGYDLALTAAVRRAPPDVGRLMRPASERRSARPISESQRESVEALVQAAPKWVRALLALVAALSAAGLAMRAIPGVRAWVPALSAAIGGGCVAAAPPAHDHQTFAILLLVMTLGLLSRALDEQRIDQPFWSAARGTLAGLLAGWMLISWTPSIFGIALIEAALGWRLFSRSAHARARGLPVLSTAFHKAALLVCLPAVIESPFTESAPFGVLDLSWFHAAWLGVLWLVFAPYAIAARSATRYPLAALLPAFAATVIVLVSTGVAADVVHAATRAADSDLSTWTLVALVLAPSGLVLVAHFSSGGTSALPWVAAATGTIMIALLQPQLALVAAAPVGVVAGLVLARVISSSH